MTTFLPYLRQLRGAEGGGVLVPEPVAVPEAPELLDEEAAHGGADPAPGGDGLLHQAAHPHVDVARVAVDAGQPVQHLLALNNRIGLKSRS